MKALLCLCLVAAACAGERAAVKSAAWSAGGAAAGAAAGSLIGPGGTIAGAAIGGGAGHLVGENADLRTGEIQGSGAADLEAERWRGEAIRATSAFDDFKRLAAKTAALVVVLAVLWFVWRNGPHIGELGFIRGILRGLAKTGG